MSLEPDVQLTVLLAEVAELQDVTSIQVELVAVSGSNATALDVDILGCSKGENHLCHYSSCFLFVLQNTAYSTLFC